ncbi:MAG: glycosyltransferase family 2 protein [bacterium]|nr:glycosyltransferase family 2 protein [bacterium]
MKANSNGSAALAVSVLMPTYKQAAFIRRALESLLSQTFERWELVIVDGASPDETEALVQPYLSDPRIHYHRLPNPTGLGEALNFATGHAHGRYLAYLPSDDVIYPDHLQALYTLLESNPHVDVAYGGVRWRYEQFSATLQGDELVGRESDFLLNPPLVTKETPLKNGNLLALVQAMYRRNHESVVRWTTQDVETSDHLERDFWRGLARQGAAFAYSGDITCEWVDHPDQRHKLIVGVAGGLARFRQYYNVPREQPLNWQPSWGPCVDERQRYTAFRQTRSLPNADGLKILLVGELGFNPERVLAFEEQGHKLYGLWYPYPESWDSTGPHSFGNIENIPYEPGWIDRVRAVQPDVIYALLNWQAIPFIHSILEARLEIPFVFHFKEGPFICQEKGTWPQLVQLVTESDGQIFINRESYEWMQLALGHALDEDRVMILDGDLPAQTWFTEDWSPKLSAQDGEPHTVCAGRIIGIDPITALAAAKIHVHFYGVQFHQMSPNFIRNGLSTGYLHLHPTVEPSEWVRELSQYDAAWFHIFDSRNRGDLRRANWDDLNLPARLGTYAAAGLPWILKDSRHSRTGLQSVAQQYDLGIFFSTPEDLAAQLHDRPRLAQLTANACAARMQFAFDTHVGALVAFFRRAIERAGVRSGV